MTLTADAFTGSLLAVEGITDAIVLLNGPTGCKFYHSHISDCQYQRASSFDPLGFTEEFYFGQPRVPCTYLEGEDYIAGSTEKLRRILSSIASKNDDLLVVVNSPGASLIGDDLKQFIDSANLSKRCLAIENAGYSSPVCEGFEQTVIEILKWMDLEGKNSSSITGKVNLVGISLYNSNWDSTADELRRILSFLNIDVETVLCAGTSIEELQISTSVACNIVVFPEYGLKIAKWYEEQFGIPYILSPMGAPVGYDATEMWIKSVASFMSVDPSQAIEILRKERKRNYHKTSRFHSLTGLPKGATFAINGDSSVVLPLTKWLYEYLGMAPVGVSTLPGGCSETETQIIDFLGKIGFSDSWKSFNDGEQVDVVLSDGHTIKMMHEKRLCRAAIEIAMPSSGYINFLPRTYVGVNGALFLLEEIFNGLRRMP
ncbi:nitrogenase component 1 [Methanolobus psychrotolerans]|uniref:nitrogenase component 1 n=1 Tax=Methanolobus psychrotolerans TaxID=1874706 RepID=UPI000B91C323|nr:nitrogenase component 1 [Methanolobus psychrotolerans]